MDRIMTRQLIKNAFQLWQESSNLKFTETFDENADIKIKFLPKVHEDSYPFHETTLAHAFPRGWSLAGDIHFNTEFHWTKDFRPLDERSVQLLPVAVHEIGHVLGLDHSKDKNSLMYYFFRAEKPFDGRLSEDDIHGIQALYPSRTAVTAATRTASSTAFVPINENANKNLVSFPDICATNVNAASVIRYELYIFRDQTFRRIYKDGNEAETATITFWTGLPSHFKKVDAVFELGNNIIFVSGKNYAELSDRTKLVKHGYIRRFGLLNIDRVDAAFNLNGDIYFFSGGRYWRYDTKLETIDSTLYPKNISVDWNGIPNDIDAAYADDVGYVNFFNRNTFYKFDLKLKRVVYIYVEPGCIKISLPNGSSKVNLSRIFNSLLILCLSLFLLVQ